MVTHINAFYGAVDEAKAKLVEAEGNLTAAETALRAHPDYKEPKKAKAAEKEPESEQDDAEEARKAEGEGLESPAENSEGDAGTPIKVSVKRKRK